MAHRPKLPSLDLKFLSWEEPEETKGVGRLSAVPAAHERATCTFPVRQAAQGPLPTLSSHTHTIVLIYSTLETLCFPRSCFIV